MFLTTQHLEEADALADRVAVIEGGHLAAVGATDAIKRQTASNTLEDAFLRLTGESAELEPVMARGA